MHNIVATRTIIASKILRRSAISIEISSKLIVPAIIAPPFLSRGAALQHSPLANSVALGLPLTNALLLLTGRPIPILHIAKEVADVYDALISSRVYRTPMPHEEAVKTIYAVEA